MKLSKIGNPEQTIDVSKEDLYSLAQGDTIKFEDESTLHINGGRKSLLQNFTVDGKPITEDFLKQIEIDTRPTSWVDKITGHIPTLTDVGNAITYGVGKMTGQLENPFEKQVKLLESRLRTSEDPEEVEKLNKQIKTLKAIMNGVDEKDLTEKQKKYLKEHNIDNSGWSSYDVVKEQDASAAPGALQGWYNVSKTVGDNVDLFDVGTAFLPIGLASKGAALVGKNLPKIGKGVVKAGEFAAKHPTLGKIGSDMTDQAITEGVHGAFTYKPEEGESMGTNALQQGGLAGLIQGGVSALGGTRLRAVKALPENVRIEKSLEELRKAGVNVPESSPLTRAGKGGLTPEEAEALRNIEIEKANKVFGKYALIDEDEIESAIKATREGIKSPLSELERWENNVLYPSSEMSKFDKKFVADEVNGAGNVVGHYVSPWEAELRGRMPSPIEHPETGKKIYPLKDVLAASYSRPYVSTTSKIGAYNPADVSAEADRMFVKNLLAPENGVTFMDEYGNVLSNVKFDKEQRQIETALKNIQDIGGLEGLNYASKPLERVAETPVQRVISQTPVVKHVPRIYEAQTLPVLRRGDVSGLWERAKANLFLDELRELSEGATNDGLFGLDIGGK